MPVMTWQYHALIVISYLTAAMCVVVAALVWRCRRQPGAAWLARLMLALGHWSLAIGLSTAAATLGASVFWSTFLYFGDAASSTLLLMFVLEVTHQGDLLPRRVRPLFWIPILAIVAGVLTNPWHGLIWPSVVAIPGDSHVYIYAHGPLYWFKIVYHLTLVAASLGLLIRSARRSTKRPRSRARLVGLAILCALPSGLIYALAPLVLPGADLTPLGFGVAGTVLAWGMMRQELFDLPLAYRTVFQSVGDAIIAIDVDGQILDFNPAAARLLGLSTLSLGRPAGQIVPGEILASPLSEGAAAAPVEVTLTAGPWTTAEVRSEPLMRGRRILGTLLTLHDISRRKQAETELQALNASLEQQVQARTAELSQSEADLRVACISLEDATVKLQELDQLKSSFLANVSHELRTPLTNIKTYISLLDSGKPERREHYLTTLKQQTDLLQHLIEQMLEIAKLDASAQRQPQFPVDVNEIAARAADEHQELAAHHNQTLTASCSDGLPAVLGSPRDLQRALGNVITNGINFSPPSTRVSVVTGWREYAGRGWCTITVADQGTGIWPEDMPHVFERFYRGQAALDRGVPGVGLGLSMCNDILVRHGGRVTIDSHYGAGTTVTIWLPAVSAEARAERVAAGNRHDTVSAN